VINKNVFLEEFQQSTINVTLFLSDRRKFSTLSRKENLVILHFIFVFSHFLTRVREYIVKVIITLK
jgi:hypothetical protein